MSYIEIEGKHKLKGTVEIGGAKNSVVALLPASILSSAKVTITNVPDISDIKYEIEILKLLNCEVIHINDKIIVDSTNIKNVPIPSELAGKLRASYYFMGALLARFGKVEISLPGGCEIGARPIDIHLFGFRKLGATVIQKKDKYIIKSKQLVGNKIYLDFASVGATVNIMLAAVTAEGTTYIENAAKEPEIVNIATLLINMGAKIVGAGTHLLIIHGVGVKKLHEATIETCPDRIETCTYIIIGALLGNLKITKIIPEHINAFLMKLQEMKVKYKVDTDTIYIYKTNDFKPAKIKTLIYPGLPTDVQQPMCAMLTQANGKSYITETLYENRYTQMVELNKMGAKIYQKGNILVINGPTNLQGEEVIAHDLRCGAALVIAGLVAEGTTKITNIQHILRGYENIIEKLTKIGAKIKLEE